MAQVMEDLKGLGAPSAPIGPRSRAPTRQPQPRHPGLLAPSPGRAE